MKDRLLGLLAKDRAMQLMRPLRGQAATIFFMHRFQDNDAGTPGHSPDQLRAYLAFLRKHGFQVISLSELITILEEGSEPHAGTIVFTIDDGYSDFARVAAPIFAEFDCPATVFLVTGFLDGKLWLWWDKVEYIVRNTVMRNASVPLGDKTFVVECSTAAQRQSAVARLTEALKHVSDIRKHQAILDLARQLEVHLPDRCPPEFAPMTWDDVRACAKLGMNFGPHTVSHPILSRVENETMLTEINDSWFRVRQETQSVVPVFSYPNGTTWSFSERERNAVRDAGMRAAVTTQPRHVTQRQFSSQDDACFAVPRFPYPRDLSRLAGMVSGVEYTRRRAIAVGHRLARKSAHSTAS